MVYIYICGKREIYCSGTTLKSCIKEWEDTLPEDRRLTVRPAQYWILYTTSFLPALGVLAAGIMVWLKRR